MTLVGGCYRDIMAKVPYLPGIILKQRVAYSPGIMLKQRVVTWEPNDPNTGGNGRYNDLQADLVALSRTNRF